MPPLRKGDSFVSQVEKWGQGALAANTPSSWGGGQGRGRGANRIQGRKGLPPCCSQIPGLKGFSSLDIPGAEIRLRRIHPISIQMPPHICPDPACCLLSPFSLCVFLLARRRVGEYCPQTSLRVPSPSVGLCSCLITGADGHPTDHPPPHHCRSLSLKHPLQVCFFLEKLRPRRDSVPTAKKSEEGTGRCLASSSVPLLGASLCSEHTAGRTWP